MKHLFVLSFMLMSLLPSASITSLAAEAPTPVSVLFFADDAELDAAKKDLMNIIYQCMDDLEKSNQMLSEKATSDEAPELYQQVDEIAKYLDHARYQLDQVTSIEELKDLQMMVMDIRKRLEELRYQIEEFEAANVFTATTIEGVEMTFKVISEEDKTCQVGDGNKRAIDKSAIGVITIPSNVNGYRVIAIADGAFNGCGNVEQIVIPEGVASIGEQGCYNCASLSTLEIPASLTNIGYVAFGVLPNLSSIKVATDNPVFDSRDNCNAIIRTSSLGLVKGCKNTIIPEGVTYIDVCAFDDEPDLVNIELPSSLRSIGSWAFAGTGLISVDIPEKVSSIGSYAFYACSKLETIKLPAAVSSIGVIAFASCPNLKTVYSYIQKPFAIADDVFASSVSSYSTLFVPAGTKALYEATEGWNKFANIVEVGDGAPSPYAVLNSDSTVLTFYYDNLKDLRAGMVVGEKRWLENKESIISVVFDPSFANYTGLTSTAGWFSECKNLKTISGLTNLKTDNVTDMNRMFFCCSSLTSLDVSGFNTSKVISMKEMFLECSSLTSLDLSSFNTENVTTMSMMFQFCYNLKDLNVSSFNTSKVTSFFQMFLDCHTLTSLDVSSFNTENVRSMRWMFGRCSNLKTLDVSGFNTSNVTSMGEMFNGCTSLTSLDLRNFDTRNVNTMWVMFGRCSSLSKLDLSSFDTSNVEYIQDMFSGCVNLTAIYVGDGWIMDKVKEGDGMFDSCTKLVGGQGTTFDASHSDYTYAHIDGGTSNPGYFTDVADAVFSDLCPDVHHPHMIDLGLPSGIRWACCNVGADKPGAHGDYFAWGETETKDSYSQDTYSFAFLGTDIAGTEYDVAHVKWGDLWAMPNLDHMNELLANCTYEPTSYDGVQGYKFTSKINGSSIFLPASGCRLGTEYVDTDHVGDYWTSNYSEISMGCASILSFHDNQAYCSSRVTREAGRSVRPIVGEASQRIFLHSKEVDGVTFALYRQAVNRFDIRKNYDGWEMYRTKVTLDITENGVTDTYLIDDALYEDVNSDGQIPCMMFDLENRMMYAFCLSKGEDVYYGMEGYVYSSPMDVVNFQKEQVFTYANWGWWTSFAGMNNGQPQLSHFSFAGYYRMASERNEDGSWTTDYIESIYPDNYKAYWQTQDLMLVLEQPVDIEPLENGDVIDFGDFVDESGVEVLPALDGNVVGNLYFNILNDNGGYDTEEGCIVITESTSDETIERIADKDFYDKELRETFTGIIFKVPAGSGNIKITAEALGSMLLKVRIGGDEPQSFELDGRQKVKIPYTVSEETLVYIYAGEDAAVKGVHPVTASSGMLRIFGIESESIPTAIADVETSGTPVTIYSVSGQRLAKPQKGINIIGGKKVVVK